MQVLFSPKVVPIIQELVKEQDRRKCNSDFRFSAMFVWPVKCTARVENRLKAEMSKEVDDGAPQTNSSRHWKIVGGGEEEKYRRSAACVKAH